MPALGVSTCQQICCVLPALQQVVIITTQLYISQHQLLQITASTEMFLPINRQQSVVSWSC